MVRRASRFLTKPFPDCQHCDVPFRSVFKDTNLGCAGTGSTVCSYTHNTAPIEDKFVGRTVMTGKSCLPVQFTVSCDRGVYGELGMPLQNSSLLPRADLNFVLLFANAGSAGCIYAVLLKRALKMFLQLQQ